MKPDDLSVRESFQGSSSVTQIGGVTCVRYVKIRPTRAKTTKIWPENVAKFKFPQIRHGCFLVPSDRNGRQREHGRLMGEGSFCLAVASFHTLRTDEARASSN